MARGLAHRHHSEAVAKAKVRARLKTVWHEKDPSPKRVGAIAHTPHCCSGPCCGNPRRWFGEMTMQERRAPQMSEGYGG